MSRTPGVYSMSTAAVLAYLAYDRIAGEGVRPETKEQVERAVRKLPQKRREGWENVAKVLADTKGETVKAKTAAHTKAELKAAVKTVGVAPVKKKAAAKKVPNKNGLPRL